MASSRKEAESIIRAYEKGIILVSFFVEYVSSVLDEVTRVSLAEDLSQSKAQQIPPSLCNNYERPSKMDAVKEHRTRFNT